MALLTFDMPYALALMPGLPLTTREREVALLVLSGSSNKEIARHLSISLATTKSHVHNILGKLSLKRRGQLATCLSGRVLSGVVKPTSFSPYSFDFLLGHVEHRTKPSRPLAAPASAA